MSRVMLHLYHLLTSFGTMAVFLTVLWTLHVDIKLINTASVDVRQRTDLSLLRNLGKFGSTLESGSCNNHSTQSSESDSVEPFTVILNISNINNNTTKIDAIKFAGENENYWSTFKKSLKSTMIVNSYFFTFNLYPGNVCSDNNVYLLIYVHSAPENYKRRMIIRNTWGNPFNIPLLKLKVKLLQLLCNCRNLKWKFASFKTRFQPGNRIHFETIESSPVIFWTIVKYKAIPAIQVPYLNSRMSWANHLLLVRFTLFIFSFCRCYFSWVLSTIQRSQPYKKHWDLSMKDMGILFREATLTATEI